MWGAACVFLLSVLPACSRQEPRPARKIAVLRFENLSGDASLEWAARGLSEVAGRALSGADGVYALHGLALRPPGDFFQPGAPGISAERDRAIEAGAHRIVYGQITLSGGRLRADAAVEDAATGRTTLTVRAEGGSPSDVLGAGEGVGALVSARVAAVRGCDLVAVPATEERRD